MDRTVDRRGALLAGTAAGAALALADWAASGLARTPPILVAADLGLGLSGGLLAGALGAALGSARLGPALVLLGGVALEGLSVASKELHGGERTLGMGLAVALALAAFLAALVATARGERGRGRAPVLGAVAALPAASWLAGALPAGPWVRLAAAAAPLAWIALARGSARRAALGWACVLLALAAAQRGGSRPRREPLGPPPAPAPENAAPSVVVLVIDTLRADAVPADGALAAFARDGVAFRQCIAAAPWTLPSVGSLLTGMLPSQHGAVSASAPLADELTTLAEHLRAAGWATAAFTGGAFVGAAHRMDQGFQVFDSGRERRFEAFGTHVPLAWRLAKNRYLPLRALVRAVDESVGLAGVLEGALRWAESEPRRPKLLLLHTYQVHDYYLYDPDVDDPVLAARPPPSPEFAGRLSVHPAELVQASQADLEHFRALYLGRIAAVERLLPELVARLTPFVGEDAVWVVTADHGEGFDAGTRRVHHGGRLHDDLLRVPLVVRAPGRLAPGRVVEESVRTVDVLPTVLELAGLAVPEGLAGESLLPALRGERAFPATAFAEELGGGFEQLAVRRGGWKWIRGPHRTELYHLSADAGERRPLDGEPPAEIGAEIEAFPQRYPARARTEIELDAATVEHLRSLGYVR